MTSAKDVSLKNYKNYTMDSCSSHYGSPIIQIKDGMNLTLGLNLELHSNILEISNTNQISNRIFSGFKFDYNIVQTVSRCPARMWRHPVATFTSPSRSRQHCGHMHHRHQSVWLLSDLTIKIILTAIKPFPTYLMYTYTS